MLLVLRGSKVGSLVLWRRSEMLVLFVVLGWSKVLFRLLIRSKVLLLGVLIRSLVLILLLIRIRSMLVLLLRPMVGLSMFVPSK